MIILHHMLFHLGFDPGLHFCRMQIRRSLLNEDEYGFRKARRPIYYDEGLEVIHLHDWTSNLSHLLEM